MNERKQTNSKSIRLPQWLSRLFKSHDVQPGTREADDLRDGTRKRSRASTPADEQTARRHSMIASRHKRQATRLAHKQRKTGAAHA